MLRICFVTLISLTMFASLPRPASAVVQFYMQYKKDFLDSHADKEYAAMVNKAANRCFVCHQGKKSRKNRNEFGQHLAELLDWKKDARNKEKIAEALKKVVALHVDPQNDKSETYLDRIKASRWPAGELENLQREPEKSETAAAP